MLQTTGIHTQLEIDSRIYMAIHQTSNDSGSTITSKTIMGHFKMILWSILNLSSQKQFRSNSK